MPAAISGHELVGQRLVGQMPNEALVEVWVRITKRKRPAREQTVGWCLKHRPVTVTGSPADGVLLRGTVPLEIENGLHCGTKIPCRTT